METYVVYTNGKSPRFLCWIDIVLDYKDNEHLQVQTGSQAPSLDLPGKRGQHNMYLCVL